MAAFCFLGFLDDVGNNLSFIFSFHGMSLGSICLLSIFLASQSGPVVTDAQSSKLESLNSLVSPFVCAWPQAMLGNFLNPIHVTGKVDRGNLTVMKDLGYCAVVYAEKATVYMSCCAPLMQNNNKCASFKSEIEVCFWTHTPLYP